MLAYASVARPGRHNTVVRALCGVPNHSAFLAGPSTLEYPCASTYNNILLRRRYATPASSSTKAKPTGRGLFPPGTPGGGSASRKKPQVDLRPGPIKPESPSSTSTKQNVNAKKEKAADAPQTQTQSSTTPSPPPRRSRSNMEDVKAKSPYFSAKSGPAPAKEPAKPQKQEDPAAAGASPRNAFEAAQEEAKQVVKDAEEHGILKPPPEGANWLRRAVHTAWELAKFYFRGVKLVFQNFKKASEIRARNRISHDLITRDEFRFAFTNERDMLKIVPFLLIALVLEELIPLIAIYVPGMLPSTCILPSQREKIEAQRREKALAFRTKYKDAIEQLLGYAEMEQSFGKRLYSLVELEHLEDVKNAPIAVCGLLGLSTLGPDFMRRSRIEERLRFISIDDDYFYTAVHNKVDLTEKLSAREVLEALEERGIFVAPTTSEAELRKLLVGWIWQSNHIKLNKDNLAGRLSMVLGRKQT